MNRIGIDVGGTFTDLIHFDDETGEVDICKVPSRPDNPAKACLDAIQTGLTARQIASSEFFVHSTTVGLNTLIQRNGAKIALLCTDGFRDVLELRRGQRVDQYNLLWSPPPPLVPRHLRVPIRERIRFDGAVHLKLVEEDISAAARLFEQEGVEVIIKNPK